MKSDASMSDGSTPGSKTVVPAKSSCVPEPDAVTVTSAKLDTMPGAWMRILSVPSV